MRSRPGNGVPASVVRGRASAAASDTAPRMPAQEMNAGHCQGGYGSRSRIRRLAHRGMYAVA